MKYERLSPRMLLSDAIKEYYQPKKMWRTFKYGKHDMLNLIDRLVELEDKIENGELIDRDEYIDRLMAAKDISGMTDKELEFFAKHNARVREQTVEEFAERVKMAFYYEFDELIPSIMADKIDELVKEVCGE